MVILESEEKMGCTILSDEELQSVQISRFVMFSNLSQRNSKIRYDLLMRKRPTTKICQEKGTKSYNHLRSIKVLVKSPFWIIRTWTTWTTYHPLTEMSGVSNETKDTKISKHECCSNTMKCSASSITKRRGRLFLLARE